MLYFGVAFVYILHVFSDKYIAHGILWKNSLSCHQSSVSSPHLCQKQVLLKLFNQLVILFS